MKRAFFQLLHKFNKAALPKLSKKDPLKLTKFEQAVVAYKYYVLINSLE